MAVPTRQFYSTQLEIGLEKLVEKIFVLHFGQGRKFISNMNIFLPLIYLIYRLLHLMDSREYFKIDPSVMEKNFSLNSTGFGKVN